MHATDITNAGRTCLYNIVDQDWDDELLDLFDVPRAILLDVKDNVVDFGTTEAEAVGQQIPVGGMAGDQQAALFGQACFKPGMVKSTYGTGCFALMNIGKHLLTSRNGLLITAAYRINGATSYALEGAIFTAGAAFLKEIQVRICPDTNAVTEQWYYDRRYTPQMSNKDQQQLLDGWTHACNRCCLE